MALATVTVVNNQVVVQPFGSELLTPLVSAAAGHATAAEGFADAAEASADLAETVTDMVIDAVIAEVVIGKTTPADGVVLAAAGTYVLSTPVSADGVLKALRCWANQNGTLKFKRFTKAGNDFTQVGSDIDVAVVTGANDVAVSSVVNEGEYLGVYQPASTLDYIAVNDPLVHYYSTSGNSSGFTDATTTTSTAIQIGFLLIVPAFTREQISSSVGGATASDQILKDWVSGECFEPTAVTWVDGLPTTATLKWPDGSGGTLTVTASDSYGVTAFTASHTLSDKTVTQAAITRTNGETTVKPALTVA